MRGKFIEYTVKRKHPRPQKVGDDFFIECFAKEEAQTVPLPFEGTEFNLIRFFQPPKDFFVFV